MNPCIAIIEGNTLCSISLRNMLWDIYNNVEVVCYQSLTSFIRDSNRHFIHFFVNSEILFSNAEEFMTLKSQTTVLTTGNDKYFAEAGFNVLDVGMNEEDISRKLLHLQFIGQYGATEATDRFCRRKERLSEREKEVLALMVRGYLNKEIAQELGISQNTAIFHRNNICEKLQTRSLGKMTIFAVLSGIVDINEI